MRYEGTICKLRTSLARRAGMTSIMLVMTTTGLASCSQEELRKNETQKHRHSMEVQSQRTEAARQNLLLQQASSERTAQIRANAELQAANYRAVQDAETNRINNGLQAETMRQANIATEETARHTAEIDAETSRERTNVIGIVAASAVFLGTVAWVFTLIQRFLKQRSRELFEWRVRREEEATARTKLLIGVVIDPDSGLDKEERASILKRLADNSNTAQLLEDHGGAASA